MKTEPRLGGFTLLEMVVVIAVLAIVLTISFHFVATVGDWYGRTVNQNRADEKATSVVMRLGREIRTLSATVNANTSAFDFVTTTGSNSIQASAGNLTLNGRLLSDGVTRFVLKYYDSTNGELAVLPLVAADRDRVRRISVDLRVSEGSAVSAVGMNWFCPRQGNLK